MVRAHFKALAVEEVANTLTHGLGLVLSIGSIVSMATQVPAGILVDRLANKRKAAAAAIVAIGLSALIFALFPAWGPIVVAEVLHGFASCVLGPAVAAITLMLIRRREIGGRLGRNAQFSSIGAGLAAGVMGACGYFSYRAVFFVTAALTLGALWMLRRIDPKDLAASHGPKKQTEPASNERIWKLITDRRLLAFAAAAVLFHLSNAAMLPLVASEMTRRIGNGGTLFIAASIVLPQLVVAGLSPKVGRAADDWGRRRVLLLGFASLPLRGLLLASTNNPYALILVQGLDGFSASTFGVMLPLIAADITRGTHHFNFCLGLLGLAIGVGATLSTSLAGFISDAFSAHTAFLMLSGIGLCSVLVILLFLPETREVEVDQEEGAETVPY